MKRRIAIITNVPSPYRVDFFYYLQTHFEKYEFFVIYYCKDSMARQWKADEEKILNSRFVPSKTIRIRKRFDDHYISFPAGIGRALSDIGPEVVVAMEYGPAILQAMGWCRRHKVKYISWTDGTTNSEKNIGKLQKLSRKYIFKRADAFIASSQKALENQLSYGAAKSRCHISLLTVDVDKYYIDGGREYGKNLLYVGSLIERKGVDLLLAAFAMCRNKEIGLTIVGDGAEKDSLISQAAALGVGARVEFKGFLEAEELRECYARAGAFVLPTREDCFGLVLIEAMCAGLPIIASKYSDGAYETVEDGVNGYIIDPCNAGEFAGAIDKVFACETVCAAMGRAGYGKTEKFRFENVAKGYIEAIENVMERRRQP